MKAGFIGAGKMAEAIIASLIDSKTLGAHEILACDIDAARRRQIKRRYGINVYSRPEHIVDVSDVIFLAVKPQNIDATVEPFASALTVNHLVISIAAGKTIADLESLMPSARVVRVMPNICSLVSQGMSVFHMGTRTKAADLKSVKVLLASFGKVMELPEKHFDAVTALSGSGPAFLAFVLQAMVESAEKMGLRKDAARFLGEQTMLGTADLLMKKKLSPETLIEAVTSAKGTTEAGLGVLGKSDVAEIIEKTLEAAARRSKELSS